MEDTSFEKISRQEIFDILDKELSPSFRSDYLRLKNGQKVPSVRRQKLKAEIIRILERYGLDG